MSLPNDRPRVGAAVMIKDLENDPALRSWLIGGNRDCEVQDFLIPKTIAGDWEMSATRAVELLDGHVGRVGIHGPFYGFALDAADPDVREIVKRRLLAGVAAAAKVSGPNRQSHMVVHSPYTTWDWYNLDTRPGSRAAMIEKVVAIMSEAVTRAENEGVTIVIENIEDKDPRDRCTLAAAFNSPAVQVSLDTGHAHYAHGATGAPPVDTFVRVAGAQLAHIHLQDADGYADRHWQIGEGNISWREVFRAIGELDQEPRLILEMSRAETILPSADWLVANELAV